MNSPFNIAIGLIGLLTLIFAGVQAFFAWKAHRARLLDEARAAAGEPPQIPKHLPSWIHESMYRTWQDLVARTALRLAPRGMTLRPVDIARARTIVQDAIDFMADLKEADLLPRRKWRKKLRDRVLAETVDILVKALAQSRSTAAARRSVAGSSNRLASPQAKGKL